MKPNAICLSLLGIAFVIQSCADQDTKENQSNARTEAEKTISLKEDSAYFSVDGITSKSFVVFDENKTGARPIVLVVPEWWGLNDFVKTKAKQLAEMGYLAMAVDMYGNGKTVDNPKDANDLSNPFYENPQMSLQRLQAAINKVKTFPQGDSSHVAGIGYCFGGGLLLNTARLGLDLDGVVSFHGNLVGTPAKKELLKAKILVCHGAADPFVPNEQAVAFKKSMDSIGANYTFKAYPDAMHAFTNPAATETGKKFNIPIAYNAAADTASWNDMKSFLGGVFTAK